MRRATQATVWKTTQSWRSVAICLPLTPLTEPHGWEPATESVAAWARHTRATEFSYDYGARLPEAQSLQSLWVEGARDRQPLALLIVTERRARLQTKPPIQRTRRKARRL